MSVFGGNCRYANEEEPMEKSVSELVDIIFRYYPFVRKAFRNLVSIKDVPISMTQLTCLNILEKNGTMSMSELADDLNMSNQQLTKVVDALVDFQMVERCVDPGNRRKINVKLTEHGTGTLLSLKREVDRKLTFLLHKMPESETQRLTDAIMTVAEFFCHEKA